jgi:hypothetical protein
VLLEEGNLIIYTNRRYQRNDNATRPDQLKAPCSANRKTYPGTARNGFIYLPQVRNSKLLTVELNENAHVSHVQRVSPYSRTSYHPVTSGVCQMFIVPFQVYVVSLFPAPQ